MHAGVFNSTRVKQRVGFFFSTCVFVWTRVRVCGGKAGNVSLLLKGWNESLQKILNKKPLLSTQPLSGQKLRLGTHSHAVDWQRVSKRLTGLLYACQAGDVVCMPPRSLVCTHIAKIVCWCALRLAGDQSRKGSASLLNLARGRLQLFAARMRTCHTENGWMNVHFMTASFHNISSSFYRWTYLGVLIAQKWH